MSVLLAVVAKIAESGGLEAREASVGEGKIDVCASTASNISRFIRYDRQHSSKGICLTHGKNFIVW